jgi:hypothetical protein
MFNSFQIEGTVLAPNGFCVDGNGHVTNVNRVCYKCKEDLKK